MKLEVFDNETLDKIPLAELIDIDQKDFPFPWNNEGWESELRSDFFLTVFRDECEKIIGFSLFKLSPLDELAHLLKVVINKEFRGKGLGRQLFSESLEALESHGYIRVYLEVEEDNGPAIALYERCHLKKLHLAKKFYSNGKSAWIMTNYDV